jgi:dolichyl-phosphate beta-glucosyltransferase
MVYLSVIIPAYNEERRLPQTLKKVLRYLEKQPYSFEIIIVDDGSTDNTVLVIENAQKRFRQIKLIKQKHQGKGGAIKTGILNSQGQYILMTDADLSVPIEEIEKLWPLIEKGCDFVIGSRAMKDSKILAHQPFFREKMGQLFTVLEKILIIRGFSESQCGFKLFKTEKIKKIFKKLKTYGPVFDVEVLVLAQKSNFIVGEMPIIWKHDQDTRFHYNLPKAIGIFVDLLKIKWRYKIWWPLKIKKLF